MKGEKYTTYCIVCVNLCIDVGIQEVGCDNGLLLRFYKGEGFKRRCGSFKHDNMTDSWDRVKMLKAIGYRNFIQPQVIK